MNLRVWYSGEEWVIAETQEQASEFAVSGGHLHHDELPEEWTALPEDQILVIVDEDFGAETHSCAEWCALNGPGFLCGNNW